MPVLLLILLGLGLLSSGWLLLRSFGPGLRIGRLLSGTPQVTLAEALELARRGSGDYVRVTGRIDAAEPFPDEFGRPLVLRRERVEVREGDRWRVVSEARREVEFALRDRLGEIEVDAAALDEGLVVIPRESTGRAGDIADRFEEPVDPGLAVRFRVDQVSAVEHAFAVGVPVLAESGSVRLEAGRGRPLILTTLELDAAMRVLAQGRRQRARLAAGLLVVGLACIALALVLAVAPLLVPATTLGASPTPTAAPVGDTRSSGEGPGLVGQPFVIALGVILLGIVSAGVAVAYARLTGPRS